MELHPLHRQDKISAKHSCIHRERTQQPWRWNVVMSMMDYPCLAINPCWIFDANYASYSIYSVVSVGAHFLNSARQPSIVPVKGRIWVFLFAVFLQRKNKVMLWSGKSSPCFVWWNNLWQGSVAPTSKHIHFKAFFMSQVWENMSHSFNACDRRDIYVIVIQGEATSKSTSRRQVIEIQLSMQVPWNRHAAVLHLATKSALTSVIHIFMAFRACFFSCALHATICRLCQCCSWRCLQPLCGTLNGLWALSYRLTLLHCHNMDLGKFN